MDKDNQLEGFFIEDDKKFKEEDILSLINRMKKFAKLIGREGKVHIVDKSLSDTDKSKVFLITRYLGTELAKVKPELKIDKNISAINVQELAEFLSVDNHNARARMSALCSEGFAKRIKRGIITVEPHQLENFIYQLEKPTEKPQIKTKTRKQKGIQKEVVKINENEILEKLSSILDTDKGRLNDVLFIKNDGTFKFNAMLGDSKYAKQKNCILCSGYILLMGFNKKTFDSRKISDICYNSNIDSSDIGQTIRTLKKQELITKAGKHSQENIIREKGKSEAIKILQKLCS